MPLKEGEFLQFPDHEKMHTSALDGSESLLGLSEFIMLCIDYCPSNPVIQSGYSEADLKQGVQQAVQCE